MDKLTFSDFTAGEKAAIAGLTARMALPRADLPKLQRRVEQIEQQALRRKHGK
ncbi:DUF6257 family protein [Streptomyces griseosporeus]|uniref:DUF6257 family protein n=1 Tax=Streptomyces griseosporeus TaxID=1910 RepID=UPI00167C6081|nr:DUF6257 family protein [Streptomyces griseosporeus]GHF57851.1 hypothetical protein GCM10018783_29040 [Streptomyces griseosporeus]